MTGYNPGSVVTLNKVALKEGSVSIFFQLVRLEDLTHTYMCTHQDSILAAAC